MSCESDLYDCHIEKHELRKCHALLTSKYEKLLAFVKNCTDLKNRQEHFQYFLAEKARNLLKEIDEHE